MQQQYLYIILFFAISLGFSACNGTKYLEENEYLLLKNEIKTNNKKLDTEQIEALVKQHGNRKILGVRFYLFTYNLYDSDKLEEKNAKKREKWKEKNAKRRKKGKNSKEFKPVLPSRIREAMGEPATVFDSSLIKKSQDQIKLYLNSKGYFHSSIDHEINYKKNPKNKQKRNRLTVSYIIDSGEPFKVIRHTYKIDDLTLLDPIKNDSKNNIIQIGGNYDEEVLEQERNRLQKSLRNQGYYYFSKDFIIYEVDTNSVPGAASIKTIIHNPLVEKEINQADTVFEGRHETYKIRNVYLNAYYNPQSPRSTEEILSDSLHYKNLIFTNKAFLFYNPEVLSKAVYIRPGDFYREGNSSYTYQRLSSLRNFNYLNISYQDVSESADSNLLDCYINITPQTRQSISTDLEGTNTNRNLGINGSINYTNRNTFLGAELFTVRLKGGIEAQQSYSGNEADSIGFDDIVNTTEYGIDVNFAIPDLLIPKKINGKMLPSYARPRTNIGMGYNNQKRYDYDRVTYSTNYSYDWSSSAELEKNNRKDYKLTPVNVSYTLIDKQPWFEDYLTSTNNAYLINSFNDQFIAGTQFSYFWSNITTNKNANSESHRFNIEMAGNLLDLASSIAGTETFQDSITGDNYSELFNIRYAQFVKFDAYNVIRKRLHDKARMVYRFWGGLGIPYGNLKSLPFDKSFYAGGTSDIRGWQARTLGPGGLTYPEAAAIDQIGDIFLEANAEYRFDFSNTLEGAVFADAGNIWMLRDDPLRPNANFEFGRFYEEIALSLGVGIRFDFSFMIIRFDGAFKIKDPQLVSGERWLFQSKDVYENEWYYNEAENKPGNYGIPFRLNFGINYPF